jgi:hypothetical protein
MAMAKAARKTGQGKTGQSKQGTKPVKTAGKKKGSTKMVTATLDQVGEAEVEESEASYRRPLPAELRRGPVTIDEIRSLQRVLSEHSVLLAKVAEELAKNGMTSLESVDGVTKGPRGRKLVSEFCANLNRSLMDALYG